MINFNNKKRFPEKRAFEGLTWNFKSLSREKSPSWANRFIRDTNDLIYQVQPHSISNRMRKSAQLATKSPEKKVQSKEISKYEYTPFQNRSKYSEKQIQQQNPGGLSLRNYIQTSQMSRNKQKEFEQTAASTAQKSRYKHEYIQPQQEDIYKNGFQQSKKKQNNLNGHMGMIQQKCIDMKPIANMKKVNLLGLSQFQFNKTIQGKLLSKSNLHLYFSKNITNKITNINKIYYDFSIDIEKPPEIVQQQYQYIYCRKQDDLKHIHTFQSYSSHKLFFASRKVRNDSNGCGNGGMLDAFYEVNTPKHYETVHERTAKMNVYYPKMTSRPEMPKTLGTQLEYKVQMIKTLGFGDSKHPWLQLSQSQRKLIFTRQIISSRRGCFR